MQQQHAAARAVFVDPTGRRPRLVARICWTLGALGVVYLALVVASLLLPPGLSRLTVPGLGPVLPGPGAAPLGAAEGEPHGPDVLLAQSPVPTPTAKPSRSPRTSAAAPVRPSAAATSAPVPTPVPTSASSPPVAPSKAAPTRRPTEPPGRSVTRSTKPRPSPTRGPK